VTRYTVESVQELTGGFGADVVIDAVGRPETWRQAFYARDLAGTVVLVGVPTPDMQLEMPLIDFFSRGGALTSSWYGDCLPERDFTTLVEDAFHTMDAGAVLRSVVVL
jgi:S-(hydroxymethyl)mycothiol dehydrogenase